MAKICYGILNYNRPLPTNQVINRINAKDKKDIVICTNDSTFRTLQNYSFVDFDKSVAVSKNNILKFAIKNGYDYCFIIEDDIKILDTSVFNNYVSLSEKFGYNLVMYGFHGRNRILDGKPNPCIRARISENEEIQFHRNVCSALMMFKVFNGMTMFDERLKALETEFLTVDMVRQNNLKFNGFFIDLKESWKNFQKIDVPTVRVRSQEFQQHDIDVRGEAISLHNSADELLNYVVKKYVDFKYGTETKSSEEIPEITII